MHEGFTLLGDITMIITGLCGLALQRAVSGLAHVGGRLPRTEPALRLPALCVPLRWDSGEVCDDTLRRRSPSALFFVGSGTSLTLGQVQATVAGMLGSRARSLVLVTDGTETTELSSGYRSLAEDPRVLVVDDRDGELAARLRVHRVPVILLFDSRGGFLGRSYAKEV